MKEFRIAYEEFDSFKDLEVTDRMLVNKAFEACENAYAPYSGFKVGAAVMLNNGEVLTGSNQENIAYPSGLCAERVVLFYAGAQFPDAEVETLCVVADGELLPKDGVLSPCGSCRQVMVETENRQHAPMRLIMVSQNQRTIIFRSAMDLLPFSFASR